MKHIFLYSTISILLVGCGAESGNKDRIMEKGEFYSVSKGDVIVKASEDALIKIIHKDGKTTSTVSLMEGDATITHPQK